MDGRIRNATKNDLAYVIELQKVWSNAVGFLTRTAIRQKLSRGQGVLVGYGGLEAGYLLHGVGRNGVLVCSQVAVSPQVLRSTLGTQLVAEMESRAVTLGVDVLRLRCREELGANAFWPVLGFSLTATIGRKSSRGQRVLEWTKHLDVELCRDPRRCQQVSGVGGDRIKSATSLGCDRPSAEMIHWSRGLPRLAERMMCSSGANCFQAVESNG